MRQLRDGLIFVSPWVVGFLLLTAYPFITTLYWSFCRYDLLTSPEWIGTENYQRLVNEVRSGQGFGQALWNTSYYAMLAIPGSILLGVGLAVLLNQKVWGQSVFRTLFFIPSVIPTVATATVWIWLLDPQQGLANRLLSLLGLAPNWFNSSAELFNPSQIVTGMAGVGSKDALVLMSLWGVGNFILIYLAALQNIPRELYEAAELDGADSLRKFWHVTLPQLTPVIFFNAVMGIVQSVQYFTQPYVISGGTGGPDGSTLVVSLHVFLWSFKYLDAGYASAVCWSLFMVVVFLTVMLFRSSRHWVHYRS
ncbi:carbohydrate ABC transporter permease [Thalassoroseus pseudoceratinae]|uniref:carbohydrate ABC transporter permease n=1 Tax=Thalassoroseus pseudoceratinae TaxID=2713176 RepID=UPI001424049F|nr:sugar ABC transporter permease [Thalassoroseus pseudoceratinae]